MTKKKAKKGKAAAKKQSNKRGAPKHRKPNPAEVLKNVSLLVEDGAIDMANAVIGEGKKGQLATVKYLWELANIYPSTADANQTSEHEESLAATLLRRLNVPESPVVADERAKEDEEDEAMMVIPARIAEARRTRAENSAEEEDGNGSEETEEEVTAGGSDTVE